MSDVRFGTPVGLLHRLRPQRVEAADLREVAHALLPCLTTPGLRVTLVERPRRGSLLVLDEDERCLRVPLGDLADDMTRAGVRPTSTGISAALASWIAHRPVTDAAAATGGIAVIDWSDDRHRAVGWRVIVRRGELALPWQPSASCDAALLHRIRSAALGRSHEVGLDLRFEGPVGLWSHPEVGLLATAALVAPDRMIQRINAVGGAMPAVGGAMDDMHVVVTPSRPVACAAPGVAARLAQETTEACVVLPWTRLADVPWL
jgi:hypothetical protein